MTGRAWRVRLLDSAKADIDEILDWSEEQFGEGQADRYRETLQLAVRSLIEGPSIPGSRVRDDIRPGLYSLHVARAGRGGRHILVYRERPGRSIEVLRVLYDGMDMVRHLPTED